MRHIFRRAPPLPRDEHRHVLEAVLTQVNEAREALNSNSGRTVARKAE